MLRISVLSLDGVAPVLPQVAEFGPEGGSIGRDAGNTLALDDPGKHLSRVQARIKWLGGEYFLVDQGGNPSCVNARELGKGKVVSLHDGDQIRMAGWALRVECPQTAATPRAAAKVAEPVLAAPVKGGGEELEFDFQLTTRLSSGPLGERDLLEAFMRGLGLQTSQLPANLDLAQAERMGAQLRILLGSQPALMADCLQTLLGSALPHAPEDGVAPAPGERPC